MDMNSVPALSRVKVEACANSLLKAAEHQLRSTLSPPIDVELIADNFLGLQIIYADLLSRYHNPDLHGGLMIPERQILVEESLSLGRTNFTIGHEVGHWMLHRDLVQIPDPAQSLLPGLAEADEPPFSQPLLCHANDKAWGERQADWFAAALMMPANSICAAFDRNFSHPQVFRKEVLKAFRDSYHAAEIYKDEAINEEVQQILRIVDLVRETGNFTNVSKTALRVRLTTMDLIGSKDHQARML